MAVWYKVDKTKSGIKEFMDCNWGFHDFRIEKLSFLPEKDIVEVFLKYDTDKEGILLHFIGVRGVTVYAGGDYLTDWIIESTLLLRERNTLQWIPGNHVTPEEMDQGMPLTWVESDELVWAVTDGEGNPIAMPNERLKQL